MAVVGEAFIVVRAITAGVEKDIKNSMRGMDRIGEDAGRRFSRSFSNGSRKGRGPISDLFKNDSKSFAQLRNEAMKVGKSFNSLQRTGYTLGTAIGVLASSVSSLIVGLVSLGGAVLSATPALAALAGGFSAVALGAITAKLALSGVAAAVQKANKQATQGKGESNEAKLAKIMQDNTEALAAADRRLTDAKRNLTKAQVAYNKAIDAGLESIQQLNFDVEDAALGEKKAAIELEKAKETLARVQDLPPNSRARREAMLAYQEADLNMRQAIDRNKDLKKERDRIGGDVKKTDEYINATENLADAQQAVVDAVAAKAKAERDAIQNVEDAKKAAAAQDPYAGLTPSQKAFAQFLAGLKPQFDSLKEAAASGFLPLLQKAIQNIVDNAFPTFRVGLNQIGTALGKASLSISKSITDAENLKDLKEIFKNSAVVIESLGRSIGNVWDSATSILVAADPITRKFFGFIESKTNSWAKMLDAKQASGELTNFFNEAGRVAAEIGKIFGNTFGGLFNIIKLNTGPGSGGQILLDYFKDITGAFKASTSYTGDGPGSMREFFRNAAENTKSILSAVGAFTKEFLKLAGDPNTKIFWDTIKTAAPMFGQILKNLNQGGPAFANLLVSITKTIEILSEAGGVNVFFNTLRKGVDILNAVLSNPAVNAIFKVTSKIHGFFLAIGLFMTAGGYALKYVLYVVLKLQKAFGILVKVVQALSFVMRAIFAASPIGAVILAVTALVAIFVILFKKNKAFHDFVMNMWEKIKGAISAVWEWVKANWPTLLAILAGPFGLLVLLVVKNFDKIKAIAVAVWEGIKAGLDLAWQGIKFIWDAIVAGVKLYVSAVTAVLGFIWDGLKAGLEATWNAIKFVWDLIVSGVKLYIDGIKAVIGFIWDGLKNGIQAAWDVVKAVWDTGKNIVSTAVNGIKSLLGAIWNGIGTGLSAAWSGVKTVWNGIVNFLVGIKNSIVTIGSNMWNGLKSGLSAVINFIISGLNWIIGALNKLKFSFPSWIPGIGGKSFGINITPIPQIQLAKGGIVSPSQGGTIARIAEAGRAERVEPLDPDGLSKRDKAMIELLAGGTNNGNTFNIYPSPGMNESELAALVSRQIAFQMRKGGA